MPKGIWREFENPAQNSNEEKSLEIKSKVDKLVRVQRSRGGRGGKTVTIIAGLGFVIMFGIASAGGDYQGLINTTLENDAIARKKKNKK